MTDKTYTEQEVREAIQRTSAFDVSPDVLIAELNRPKASFSEGEVVHWHATGPGVRGYGKYRESVPREFGTLTSKLTHSEHSAEVRKLVDAVQRAEVMSCSEGYSYGEIHNVIFPALAAYRAAHGGNEQ